MFGHLAMMPDKLGNMEEKGTSHTPRSNTTSRYCLPMLCDAQFVYA
jgi:hypothetical protein